MPGGRPTPYNKKLHPGWYGSLCELGRTDDEAAKEMGIATSTLSLWKKKHKEFSEAQKRKEIPNLSIEKSVFQRAKGYDYEEVKIIKETKAVIDENEDGEESIHYEETGYEKVETYKKKFHGSDVCAIFFLKNRDPSRWKDKIHNVHESDKLDEVIEKMGSIYAKAMNKKK